jgi:hypothetical protein
MNAKLTYSFCVHGPDFEPICKTQPIIYQSLEECEARASYFNTDPNVYRAFEGRTPKQGISVQRPVFCEVSQTKLEDGSSYFIGFLILLAVASVGIMRMAKGCYK